MRGTRCRARTVTATQDQAYARWRQAPERFWGEAAEAVHWYTRWNQVLDASQPPYNRWFAGGVVNTCYNALDRHVVTGRAEQPALIYDSPVTQTIQRFTYRELLDQVSRFAGALQAQGVGKGDRVIIYMPMVPEAAIAMLACARIGAIHSVVFGGFASHELAARIGHAEPRVIVSASCGIEPSRVVPYKPLLDKAIELASAKPNRCIIPQRPQERAAMVAGRDVEWSELMAKAQPADCVPVAATDPLYILYTSGTTGMPKGIVRDALSRFRMRFLAGERCDPDTRGWAERRLGVPVIDHWWQTETGWPIGANCVGLGMIPVKPGSCARAVPGYDVRVLGADGREVPSGQTGSLVVKLPLPPGCLPTLWDNDAGFVQSYLSQYPGYYLTADAGYKDADGYLWVMSRTDDIINVAGHRLSTGAMEEVLASHPDVAECAGVGVR